MLTRRNMLLSAAAVPLAGLNAGGARADTAPVYSRDGIAINGFDPVAYFTRKTHVPGKSAHMVDWRGARWLFASIENRSEFEADPQIFAPQYGGYCAFAMAHGAIAKTDPDAWTVYEGKLNLNYSLAVRDQWGQDIPTYIKRANSHWPGILNA